MSENSDQELLTGYPWLTKDLFKEIVENDIENEPISIENFLVKRALGHGENYASVMIRITIHYRLSGRSDELKETRFIVKTNHIDEFLKKVYKELKIFDKEIIYFHKILPDVEKLLRSIGDNTKLAPKCYGVSFDDAYLIFEDLTSKNYMNTDRSYGLDIDHFKKVLEKMAKYHAATALLISQNRIDLTEFLEPIFTENSDDIRKFTTIFLQSVAESIKSLKGLEHISEKMNKIKESVFLKFCQLMKPDANVFNALTHGDLWVNNIMFKYNKEDESSPIDALLVDFQISLYGPAVLDLAYLLFSSSHEDINDQQWDKVIQYYHEILKDTLIKLEYPEKIPTLTDIQVQFLQKGQCVMNMGLLFQGLRRFKEADERINHSFLCDTEEYREIRTKILTNPKSEKSMRFLLDYFDRKGFLEC